ncbi:MAG: NAD(P)H-dependent glycerol-3-phosphate dehydrogenase [Thermomicrobiales bacterium]
MIDQGIARGRVVVAGGGAWGTTLALVALRAGCEVTLLVRKESVANDMHRLRMHPHSLPGIYLPDELEITSDPQLAFSATGATIIAVPTQSLRTYAESIVPYIESRTIVSAAKGLEVGTKRRPSEILMDVLGEGAADRIAVISGPNLAGEIAAGKPAASVVASTNPDTARLVQHLLHSQSFRTYASSDVVGVELGGALKNIIAIGAGIADGLGVGDNAKASFLTRGIAEMTRIGIACGVNGSTFGGLSGIGDLMATCSSKLSRNYRVGFGIASGQRLTEILSQKGETAEGVPTTRAALELAAALEVELPIAKQIARVLFEGYSPDEAINDLMSREATDELSA